MDGDFQLGQVVQLKDQPTVWGWITSLEASRIEVNTRTRQRYWLPIADAILPSAQYSDEDLKIVAVDSNARVRAMAHLSHMLIADLNAARNGDYTNFKRLNDAWDSIHHLQSSYFRNGYGVELREVLTPDVCMEVTQQVSKALKFSYRDMVQLWDSQPRRRR